MEPQAILQSDPLDVLFDNRNKSYGAYPLRKYYNQRLLMSMSVMLSTVILLIVLVAHFQTTPILVRDYPIPDVLPEIFPPKVKEKIILPPARPAAQRPLATVVNTPPVIVADPDVHKPLPTVHDLDISAIGVTTTAGKPDNGMPASNGNSVQGTSVSSRDSAEGAPAILEHAEFMPEFPGGIEALKRFLLKNLRMPDNDLQPGEQIRVVARFIVGPDGQVRDVEIVQAADMPYNKEVQRVISKMPDWKPGMQNHHAVAVYFSLPVNFVNSEQ